MRLASLAIVAACSAAPATAQDRCLPTPQAYETLANQYGEERRGYGVTEQGTIIEFWTGEQSWTFFVTRHDGTSCLLANGADWGYAPVDKEPDL